MFSHKALFWAAFLMMAGLLGWATGYAVELYAGRDVYEGTVKLIDRSTKTGEFTPRGVKRIPSRGVATFESVPPYTWSAAYILIGVLVALGATRLMRDSLPDLTAIALKSVRQRAMASSMTALSVALGVALMVTVFVINGVVTRLFSQSATGYHLILGAKGSPMQLVLNTIYFMDKPIENVPYSEYLKIKNAGWVQHAIPFALGDTTPDGKYRTVGTIPEYFEVPYVPNKKFILREGKFIANAQDAVLGSRVAREYGWKLGHQFPIAHAGNVRDLHTDNPFTVAGILEPTGTPADRAVFLHLTGFYAISGHEKPREQVLERAEAFGQSVDESDPFFDKDVTAVLVRVKHAPTAVIMQSHINKMPIFQAANPIEQIGRLLRDVVNNVKTLLVVMTSLIIAVSGMGIFVSIYNSMADRRREIAIMRALGANRATVFSIIVTESVLICLAGGIGGLLLGHAMVLVAAPIVESRADILINPWSFEPVELCLLPALFVLAIIVGVIPAITAYRADVAKNLVE